MKSTDLAFPAFNNKGECMNDSVGLTIREHFAALFLQGSLASYTSTSWPDAQVFAQKAVEYADALINELNKNAQTINQ